MDLGLVFVVVVFKGFAPRLGHTLTYTLLREAGTQFIHKSSARTRLRPERPDVYEECFKASLERSVRLLMKIQAIGTVFRLTACWGAMVIPMPVVSKSEPLDALFGASSTRLRLRTGVCRVCDVWRIMDIPRCLFPPGLSRDRFLRRDDERKPVNLRPDRIGDYTIKFFLALPQPLLTPSTHRPFYLYIRKYPSI